MAIYKKESIVVVNNVKYNVVYDYIVNGDDHQCNLHTIDGAGAPHPHFMDCLDAIHRLEWDNPQAVGYSSNPESEEDEPVQPVLNLTQHQPTPEQMSSGVINPHNVDKVKKLLTFDHIPTAENMAIRARELALIAVNNGVKTALIGGAPYFMPYLEQALFQYDITPCYSFSERASVEKTLDDGSVQKINVFKHVAFINSINNYNV